MITFSKFFELFLENYNEVRIYNSMVRLPMDKPYGFWMDKHGNFAVVKGGMGSHEKIGKLILDQLGIDSGESVYETLFENGWVRVMLDRNKTYYEKSHLRLLTRIQKRNLSFINEFYELKGVEEG
jgi:hypothetical protein